MNSEIKFKSLNDLYKRLYPALNTRKAELNREGIKVLELDIWNYLSGSLWAKNNSLSLCDMVKDILEVPEDKIINYLHKKQRQEGEEIAN